MYKLSAFMSMTAMANNTPGANSPIGELSNTSGTSSKEVGKYYNQQYPDVRLLSFSSIDETTDTKVPVDPLYSNKLLQLGQWLFTKSIDGALSDNKENAQQIITAEFNGDFEILAMGSMVTNGVYWLPEYLFVKELTSTEDNILRVWFSDPAFKAQYDISELIPVAPISNLDDFHKDRATVLALIDAINATDVINRAQEIANAAPATLRISRDFDWVDKADDTVRAPVPWALVIYGLAGNNEDVIRQTLQDYILANSEYPREEWEKIFPDIFRPTEFYLIPAWDRESLPPQQTKGGLYSPTMPLADFASYGRQFIPDADDAYLGANLVAAATMFKGLIMATAGNPRNRYDLFRFDELWPKYIALTTTGHDFNRIPPETQNFCLRLIEWLRIAETMSEYSELPTGMSRVERNGKVYLAASIDEVLYLTAVKSNEINHGG